MAVILQNDPTFIYEHVKSQYLKLCDLLNQTKLFIFFMSALADREILFLFSIADFPRFLTIRHRYILTNSKKSDKIILCRNNSKN